MTSLSPNISWQNSLPYNAYTPYATGYQHPYYYQQLQPYYADTTAFRPAESWYVQPPLPSTMPVTPLIDNPHSIAPAPNKFLLPDSTLQPPTVQKPAVDLFRETPLRYGGYLNEAGEAFNSIISKSAVRWSYHLTAVYVALDTIEKAVRGFSGKQGSTSDKLLNGGKEAADAAIFQYFASYLVPAKIIEVGKNFLDKAATQSLKSPMLRKWGPTAISLAAIPLIVSPIDHATHWTMNRVVRPWLGTKPHH